MNDTQSPSYAGAPVERPAMDEAQFAFDNEREIAVSRLASPAVMARLLLELTERVEALEKANRINIHLMKTAERRL